MPEKSNAAPYLFGDLLALARQSWVRQMEGRLDRLGFADYRRSDAATLRLLQRAPVPIGRLGIALGVTRQAARKVADGLGERDYARTERDARDSRKLNIVLTTRGELYAGAVVEVIEALNAELRDRVDLSQLKAADAVLRAAIADDEAARRIATLVRAPG